jgi:hypothetical protein
MEPVTLVWFVVATVGATAMSAANVKEWGRGDLAWNLGLPLLLVGVVAFGWHVGWAAWRLWWWRIRAEPSEEELARALLRDLRYDWRRILRITGWFRARDVPQRLPVLLVAGSGAGDPRPALLDAYLRWHSPRLPRSLWWLVAAVRRPSAVMVTDCERLDHVPVAGWVRSLAGQRAWLRPLLVLALRWSAGARRHPGLRRFLITLVITLVQVWRRVIVVAAPRRARHRARRLLQLGLVLLLTAGWFYLDRSTSQPYCLGWPWSDQALSAETPDGEWIGYRTCLGWAQLGADITNGTAASLLSPLTVRGPGPDDNSHLFDLNLIYEENKRAQRLATAARPLVTVAVVTALTTADPTKPVRSVVAEREGLAGVYAAQRRINTLRSTRQPYLRIAIVNAGDLVPGPPGDDARDRVVRNHLTILENKLRLLAADQTLAAAIVTVNSTTGIQQALGNSLARYGVAMVSPTMTADGFGDPFGRPPVFFQVGSTDDNQVQLIYEYARNQHRPLAFFYPELTNGKKRYIDTNDVYVTSLYCDVWRRYRQAPGSFQGPSDGHSVHCPPDAPQTTQRLGAREAAPPGDKPKPVPVSMAHWSAGTDLTQVAAFACPADGAQPLVFFGGRYTDVADFTQALRLACGPRMPQVQVAVADSSSRFLADRDLARHAPHGTQVLIAYRGRILTCDNLRNNRQEDGDSSFDTGRRADFYDDIKTSLHRCTGGGDSEIDRWLAAGWAAIGYDSLLMINDAMLRTGLQYVPTVRANVLGCLRGTTDPCRDAVYPGVYGTVRIASTGVGIASTGVGQRVTTLLQVTDLATAFEAPDTVRIVGTCRPQSTPCTAMFNK